MVWDHLCLVVEERESGRCRCGSIYVLDNHQHYANHGAWYLFFLCSHRLIATSFRLCATPEYYPGIWILSHHTRPLRLRTDQGFLYQGIWKSAKICKYRPLPYVIANGDIAYVSNTVPHARLIDRRDQVTVRWWVYTFDFPCISGWLLPWLLVVWQLCWRMWPSLSMGE